MRARPARWGRSGFVVAIPARGEARRLPGALRALAADGVRDVMVVANGCSDATAAVARAGVPGLRMAVIETGALPGGVGEARRIGLAAALEAAGPGAILATTDADCAVRPGWRIALTAALRDGAGLACGRIVPDAAELAALPYTVQRHGRLEDLRNDLRATLAIPASRDPRHDQEAGAALAFRASAYGAAGGFDRVRCHEDREIASRMRRLGLGVAHPWAAVVVASCRLAGRACGGMADTIAARAAGPAGIEAEMPDLRAQLSDMATRLRARPGGVLAWARLVAEHAHVDPRDLPPAAGQGGTVAERGPAILTNHGCASALPLPSKMDEPT